jgi:hypothetical protein
MREFLDDDLEQQERLDKRIDRLIDELIQIKTRKANYKFTPGFIERERQRP